MKSETNQSYGVLKRPLSKTLKYRKTPEHLKVNLYFIYTK